MRSPISLIAILFATIVCIPKAEAVCDPSTPSGSYAFTSVRFVITSTGYIPRASSGVLYFDGAGNMSFVSVESTGTKTIPFSGSGTYTVSPLILVDPIVSSCLLSVTINGKTTTQTYYLALDGSAYYGVDNSTEKQIVSVQANKVS